MARAFSVASWNVEHFGAAGTRDRKPRKPIEPAIEFIVRNKADVIALYEVESAVVFRPLLEALPGYQFHVTEGPQVQEILVAVRRRLTAFVTQKTQFRAGQSTLRPGVLVTPLVDGAVYPLLFLHLKSLPDPRGFGLRQDMIERAFRFRRRLDRHAPDGRANYIFLGDLNTMGLNLRGGAHDIGARDEIAMLEHEAGLARNRMRVLPRGGATFWKGPGSSLPPSELDHVVAAEHLRFRSVGGHEVQLRGWPQESTEDAQGRWIEAHSDHAMLRFEVQKV